MLEVHRNLLNFEIKVAKGRVDYQKVDFAANSQFTQFSQGLRISEDFFKNKTFLMNEIE